jgi:hypothetical protein
MVDEGVRIEVSRLALEDVLGELEHLLRRLGVGDFVEILAGVAHLVGVAQRRAEQALLPRLQRDHALALGQDDPAERDHVLAAHRVADHAERFAADLIVRRDVIAAVVVALVDLRARHEAVDVDGVVALDLQRLDLFVFDLDVDALVDLVTAALVGRLDHLAGHVVDELLPQAVAGQLVDLAEGHALRTGGRREHRNRARDQR